MGGVSVGCVRHGPVGAYVFVAGGIGITPILPMLRAVDAQPGLEWRLLYGGRSLASMPYLPETEKPGAGTSC